MSSRGTDFFISHAGRDTGWAEWLGWQLQQAGYSVELDVWDWAPGEDFVARMAAALESADRVLAVCTEAYFASHSAARSCVRPSPDPQRPRGGSCRCWSSRSPFRRCTPR